MKVRLFDKNRIYLFDGSKGSMLLKYGMQPGELAENYNLEKEDIVLRIYKEYCDAGSDIIQTNTLCANRMTLAQHGLEDKLDLINKKSIDLARKAIGDRDILVAASIGPLPELVYPSGSLSFDEAYDLFKEQILACKDADLLNFETFTDLKQMRIALIANRDTVNLPVVANMTFEQNNMTLMGQSPFICSGILKKIGADVVGVNCSNGPDKMDRILTDISKFEDFTCVKPNAGMPHMKDGLVYYDQDSPTFCMNMKSLLKYNLGITGGCCGTSPEYIKDLNYIKKESRQVTIKTDQSNYLFSQFSYLDIDKDYLKYVLDLDGQTEDDFVDLAYDILDSHEDVVVVTYRGESKEYIIKFVEECQDIIKKPIIFNIYDQAVLKTALKYYCGIAGYTKDMESVYGALHVNLS